MARFQLTSRALDNAKPTPKEYLLADGEDLYLRVRPSGAKSWVYVYSLGGTRKKYTIGPFPAIALTQARDRADHCRQLIAVGVHPAENDKRIAVEEKAQAAELLLEDAPQTVAELFARWDAAHLQPKLKDKGLAVRGICNKHLIPVIGDIPLDKLRPRHISAVLDKARATGIGRTCGILLSNVRQMCQYALPREWLQGDPTAGLKAKSWGGGSNERERHLANEIEELDKKLRESKLPERWKHAVWLMIATGNRVGETLMASTAEVNLRKGQWIIPPENQKKTKAKPRTHIVDLSPFALRHMYRVIELANKDKDEKAKWLFPARGGNGEKPVGEKSLTKLIKDRQREKPIKGRTTAINDLVLSGGLWTPHDLRRTMSTLMGEIGIDPDIIDKCQNHSDPNKIKRTYQRQKMRAAMHAAWLALGSHLEALTEDI